MSWRQRFVPVEYTIASGQTDTPESAGNAFMRTVYLAADRVERFPFEKQLNDLGIADCWAFYEVKSFQARRTEAPSRAGPSFPSM